MEQLIAHLVGDYILQNNWMANEKTKNTLKGWIACLIHVILYCVPFLFLISNVWQLLVIFLSHLLIDKFKLAVVWIKFWNWSWQNDNFGYPSTMPFALSVWLMIIIDNTFHILINYLALTFI